jgi:polysaccharide pyruvyl transferase WcaK-like protein
LGVSVYRSLSNKENNLSNYIVLAKIIDDFILKTNKSVRIFAFDTENENDLSAAHHVFNLCKNIEKIQILPYLGNENEFLTRYAECEKMIGIRFHSAIISDLLKIPFLPIIYSNKMRNWLEDNHFAGEYLYIENFKEDLIDVEKLVDELIEGSNLFYRDNERENNFELHFNKLRELLNG